MSQIDQQMDVGQDQVSELKKFTIWGKTLPELTAHAMSYFDGDTQFNYSQCSKICNKEIQRFDKYIPTFLSLTSLENDGISVRWVLDNKNCSIVMDFVNMEGGKHTWTLQSTKRWRKPKYTERVYQGEENTQYDGTAMQGAIKMLSQRFKNRKDEKLRIAMKLHSWPVGLSSFLEHVYDSVWMIEIAEPAYEGFIESMKNCPTKMRLTLEPIDENNTFCLPATFMETELFKNLEIFFCQLPLDITDDQFVNSQAWYLYLVEATFSDQTIYRKLRKWVDDKDCCYDFLVKGNENWIRDNIIGSLPHQILDEDRYIITKEDGGVKGELNFLSDVLQFRDERAPFF